MQDLLIGLRLEMNMSFHDEIINNYMQAVLPEVTCIFFGHVSG
ncbi:MAG TPA: hypothetical protein O0X97_06015 [Methanocorpusculum sp.]|nr:hypothetical protein [Methanocorpusculum sp.]